jgi:hypothetical protein
VGSFGKTFHATGWKVGWAAAPAPLTSELRKVHQFVTFATSTPAQHALADVLEAEPERVTELSSFYQRKRDRFRELIVNTRFRPFPVAGAYFQLVDYSDIASMPDTEFARYLTTTIGVAAIPLSPFYAAPPETTIVRFCFAKNEQTPSLQPTPANRLESLSPLRGRRGRVFCSTGALGTVRRSKRAISNGPVATRLLLTLRRSAANVAAIVIASISYFWEH